MELCLLDTFLNNQYLKAQRDELFISHFIIFVCLDLGPNY